MTKLAPEWVRTSDPVIRSPARYRWTTAPAPHEGQGASGSDTNNITSRPRKFIQSALSWSSVFNRNCLGRKINLRS